MGGAGITDVGGAMKTIVFTDATAVAHYAASRVVVIACAAIQARGIFTIALAGGASPRELYQLLATPEYSRQIDWAHTQVFWSDERCVLPDDDASNYNLAKTALLDHIPLPAANIHRIKGDLPPDVAVREYVAELLPYPAIDLILLGLGTDGHTASLFPGSPALQSADAVVAVFEPSLAVPHRITLTPSFINAAAHRLFLVTGAAKAQILQAVLAGPVKYPAQLITDAEWVVDVAVIRQNVAFSIHDK